MDSPVELFPDSKYFSRYLLCSDPTLFKATISLSRTLYLPGSCQMQIANIYIQSCVMVAVTWFQLKAWSAHCRCLLNINVCYRQSRWNLFKKIQCSECKIEIGFLVETERQWKLYFFLLFYCSATRISVYCHPLLLHIGGNQLFIMHPNKNTALCLTEVVLNA